MTMVAFIFFGQLVFSFMRTLAVRKIATGKRYQLMALNAAGSLLRLLVMTGGITSVMKENWTAVAVFVLAGACGDFFAMHEQRKEAT